MYTLTISDIKKRGSKAIKDDKVSYLLVNSKVKSAIVPAKDYEMLIEMLEDLQDIKDAKARIKEPAVALEKAVKEVEES